MTEGAPASDEARPSRRLRALFLALIVLGFADAVRRMWLCDDAFISFRYAQHLASGQGLVFNVGEHVQGYTNPLLTLTLAGLVKLGLPMEASAIGLGLLAFAGTLALLWRHARSAGTLPFAALGLVAMPHVRDFATSGLETSSFIFFVLGAVLAASRADTSRRAFVVGVLASLAALTRPDGLLVYGLLGLFALAQAVRERRPRPVFAMAAPALILLAPWLGFALSYYGDVVPNTFYAKSAAHPWIFQGARYVGLFLLVYAPLLGGLALLFRGAKRAPQRIWLVVTVAWFAYVAWVGGDFMFARFCLPAVPLLLLALESWLSRVVPQRKGALFGLLLAGLLLAAPTEWVLGFAPNVADEHEFYQSPSCDLSSARHAGEVIRSHVEGTDARVVFVGSQARIAYYGRLPYALEAITGLTDREIAHHPIHERGRVGHEKTVTREYLQERGMNLIFDYCQQSLTTAPYDSVDLGEGVTGHVYAYDAALMRRLRARGAHITSFEDYLDAYLAGMDQRSSVEVATDYEEFRRYYFAHTIDPEREARFLTRARR